MKELSYFNKKLNRVEGFTLLELAVVSLIITILVSIAIPMILRSRIQSNESATIWNLRCISTAQITFQSVKNRYGSFVDLTQVIPNQEAWYLDPSWYEGCIKHGYVYTMPDVTDVLFVCYASPYRRGYSGMRYFRVDNSGIIRYNPDQPPAPDDPPISESE